MAMAMADKISFITLGFRRASWREAHRPSSCNLHGSSNPFSSGARQMLRALLEQREAEQAKQVENIMEKKKGGKNKDSGHKQEASPVVKAHMQMLQSGDSKSSSLKATPSPPVDAWKVREKWACMKGCGACCLLQKGPEYPDIEEILTDPSEVALYKSMIGKDGWCINFDKSSRKCMIYKERPRFCRIQPEVFEDLYNIQEKELDKEACSMCRDAISDVYGCKSSELKNFERLIASFRK